MAVLETTEPKSIFTLVSLFSLLGVLGISTVAYGASRAYLPKRATRTERATFIWLAFDALIHFFYEGSWLWLSMFGRQVNTSTGPLAEMWKEYTLADARWGTADPTVVSLELLTVLGAGPLAVYILSQLARGDPARHYWIVVICTGELYGGWMTFCPEWLTGSPSLDTSNLLYLWVYLFFMNTIWVVVPSWLMYDSYGHIAKSLRAQQALATLKQQ
ncbi:Emopamil-binding protein [Schizophyllum amplum]|uniref:Emopamil-binding protein n=1 Tax=Schizophyllum amplum TaxID=97359 RepID=A0A550CHA8_9AGAR|nr:Emopamil-binding protein [Auriculariopsis ampla]